MVRLRSCYFCGTTGALSEYEARSRTAAAERPRVVLCDRCHTKLTSVLTTFVGDVDLAAVDASVAADHSAAEPPVADDHPTETSSERTSDPDDQPTQPEVTFAESVSADAPASEATAPNAAEASDDTDDADESEAATDATEPMRGDAGPDGDEERDEVDAGSSADLDRVYHKLLRFLRNREFPIPRAEAEAVAQSAYDLSATEASRIVQRTVDRGVLEERDGELYRR